MRDQSITIPAVCCSVALDDGNTLPVPTIDGFAMNLMSDGRFAVRDFYQFARRHAREIDEIVRARNFASPAYVDDGDTSFDLTILIQPAGQPTLLDMAAIALEFEARWGKRVQLVTPDVLGQENRHLVRELEAV